MVCLLGVFSSVCPVSGAVKDTPHDQPIGGQGICSACHLPHSALGERLWPLSMNSSEEDFGVVGSLCYYCHGTGGGAGLPNAVQNLIMDPALAEFSHGRDSRDLPSSGDSMDSSLPYGGDSTFECTTCHEVHDATNNPFLQDDMDVLCSRCHKDRQFIGGTEQIAQGAWGDNYGLQNPGSHPIGTDVFEDIDQNSPVDLADAGVFTIPYGPTEGHNLGGHLIDGGTQPQNGNGMTCVTCHAVHGTQMDEDPPVGGTPAVPNLLVIEQPTEGGAFDGKVFNGNGDPNNPLCEACHISEVETIDSGTGLAYTGSYNVNPGVTKYTHPVDDMGAAGNFSANKLPADWPQGKTAGVNSSYGVICESCHTPHPAANIDRPTILAESGTHILRATEESGDPQNICNQCHDFMGAQSCSHPANVPMGRMFDPDIGNNDAVLTCDDCHFGGAHNWTGPDIGLDPDWEPPGNGQGPEELERISENTSKECVDCHHANNTISGPTNNSADDGSKVSHTWRTSDSYQDIGEGTHYIGPTSMDYSLGLFNGGAFNAVTDYWTGQGQENPRWSRFDGESGTIVCESCHELEADKNVPGTAALLARYVEGGTEADDDPSGLCEGCHGHSPGGSGTPHPMTGDIVSRTGASISTTSSYTRSTIEGNATYPGSNAVNCDSCHQPHDADTHGGTYIYESGEHTSPPHDVTSSNTTDGSVRGSLIPDIEDAPFCDSCHFYLR